VRFSWRAGSRFARASFVFCQLLSRSSSAEDVTRLRSVVTDSPHYVATSAGPANFGGQRVFETRHEGIRRRSANQTSVAGRELTIFCPTGKGNLPVGDKSRP
jgi:hypothetical protein